VTDEQVRQKVAADYYHLNFLKTFCFDAPVHVLSCNVIVYLHSAPSRYVLREALSTLTYMMVNVIMNK